MNSFETPQPLASPEVGREHRLGDFDNLIKERNAAREAANKVKELDEELKDKLEYYQSNINTDNEFEKEAARSLRSRVYDQPEGIDTINQPNEVEYIQPETEVPTETEETFESESTPIYQSLMDEYGHDDDTPPEAEDDLPEHSIDSEDRFRHFKNYKLPKISEEDVKNLISDQEAEEKYGSEISEIPYFGEQYTSATSAEEAQPNKMDASPGVLDQINALQQENANLKQTVETQNNTIENLTNKVEDLTKQLSEVIGQLRQNSAEKTPDENPESEPMDGSAEPEQESVVNEAEQDQPEAEPSTPDTESESDDGYEDGGADEEKKGWRYYMNRSTIAFKSFKDKLRGKEGTKRRKITNWAVGTVAVVGAVWIASKNGVIDDAIHGHGGGSGSPDQYGGGGGSNVVTPEMADAARNVHKGEGWLETLRDMGYNKQEAWEKLPKLLQTDNPGIKEWVYEMKNGNPGISHTGQMPDSVLKSIQNL